MKRTDAKYIVDEIKKKHDFHKMFTPWESKFFSDLDRIVNTYGLVVSDKQGEILQRIYRKVWGEGL